MPHTISEVTELSRPKQRQQARRPNASFRQHAQLSQILEEVQQLYIASELCQNIAQQIRAVSRSRSAPITTLVSLGLGSLTVSKYASRRIKQLAILLAVGAVLYSIRGSPIEIFAQDPSFTRMDESLLRGLGIQILHTSSANSLGEAASILSSTTLVYSPFLTLEVYEQLLNTSPAHVPLVLGDDFTALLKKWPKHSPEHKQVEALIKMCLTRYRRRVVAGKGFWSDEDGSFPMAVYELGEGRDKAKLLKAKI